MILTRRVDDSYHLWETRYEERGGVEVRITTVWLWPDRFPVGKSLATVKGDKSRNPRHEDIEREWRENLDKARSGLRPDDNGGWNASAPEWREPTREQHRKMAAWAATLD